MSSGEAGSISMLIWLTIIMGAKALQKVVSRNRRRGKDWEQDEPWPECFDEEDE